ncbi:ferric reductase [Senna tora]|uniref:Ferric reductase n=1 Tax=Senna tora TaxID=362788 RepID=A0A834SZN7_9FABA|nr:ferric reductase [Senna tora]
MVFLNVPSISKLQWHPFTVTSSSNMDSDELSVAIKTQGSWSHKLYDILLSSNLDRLQVSLEGPYGPSSSHFLRHEQLILVSGGSGITPFVSIIRDLLSQTQSQLQNQNDQNDVVVIPRVLLICAFKSSSDLTLLDLILPLTPSPSASTAQISRLHIQIQAYVTREAHEPPPPQAQAHTTRTLWFKPSPTLDSPISPVLGPNNWLWLAVIISSSFLMFLLLLGLVTRYYIYPLENEGPSGGVYHWTFKVLWFLFLQCAAIWVCCSVVFVWCKRRSGLESRQILNVECPTSEESPGSWRIYGSEREVESVPRRSLLEATKVYYGSRPDLKKILSECKGDDVGVLVCGPKKMRHEVATLCSSHSSGNNLHFEAISFNW